MRTWMLAPDGVWAEVTNQLIGCGPEPAGWDWPDVVADIAGTTVDLGHVMSFDRGDLVSVHGNVPDRWVANLIWSTLCTDRVDAVTAIRIAATPHAVWLDAVAAWTGRPVGEPLEAWAQRRGRWLLAAHSRSDRPVPLDGVRMVVGAVP